MTAASTAWVVTQGEYSDYRICAVCPTQADAEALAARANETEESEYHEYRVESVFLADADLEKVTTFYRSVTVWDDGRTTETNPGGHRLAVGVEHHHTQGPLAMGSCSDPQRPWWAAGRLRHVCSAGCQGVLGPACPPAG